MRLNVGIGLEERSTTVIAVEHIDVGAYDELTVVHATRLAVTPEVSEAEELAELLRGPLHEAGKVLIGPGGYGLVTALKRLREEKRIPERLVLNTTPGLPARELDRLVGRVAAAFDRDILRFASGLETPIVQDLARELAGARKYLTSTGGRSKIETQPELLGGALMALILACKRGGAEPRFRIGGKTFASINDAALAGVQLHHARLRL